MNRLTAHGGRGVKRRGGVKKRERGELAPRQRSVRLGVGEDGKFQKRKTVKIVFVKKWRANNYFA
jgi:hypothetical protein